MLVYSAGFVMSHRHQKKWCIKCYLFCSHEALLLISCKVLEFKFLQEDSVHTANRWVNIEIWVSQFQEFTFLEWFDMDWVFTGFFVGWVNNVRVMGTHNLFAAYLNVITSCIALPDFMTMDMFHILLVSGIWLKLLQVAYTCTWYACLRCARAKQNSKLEPWNVALFYNLKLLFRS